MYCLYDVRAKFVYNLNAAPHPLRQSWFMNHYWAISPLHPNNSSTMLHSSVCPPLHQSYLSLTYNCVILVHVMSPSHCSGFHGAVHRSVPLLTSTDCFAACIAFPAACSVSLILLCPCLCTAFNKHVLWSFFTTAQVRC
jgi:hypothetical protein